MSINTISTLQVMLLVDKSEKEIYSELFAEPETYLEMFKSLDRIADAKNTDAFELLEMVIPQKHFREYLIEKLIKVADDLMDHCEEAPTHTEWKGADEFEMAYDDYDDYTDYHRYELANLIYKMYV